MMEKNEEKYSRVLELLKSSQPRPGSIDAIEQRVMSEIIESKDKSSIHTEIMKLLFGWTSVAWIRRSLLTASMTLVVVFAVQQGILMREMSGIEKMQVPSGARNSTSRQCRNGVSGIPAGLSSKIEKLQRRKLTDKRIDELLEAFDKSGYSYSDLGTVIGTNPDLKRFLWIKLQGIDNHQ